MNPSAISTTEAVDAVFFYIFGISIAILIALTAVMVWFLVKYNRKRHPHPKASPRYNILLEASWTIIPTIIVLSMFWYGWEGYTTLSNVPEDALEVRVTARMWSWTFTYPNGKTDDRLVVPAGRAVSVSITSEDVLHSFYVPAFRVKRDAVPGMITRAWFRAPEPGSYDLFCAEYCGVGHSAMITTVEAMAEKEFEEWYRRPIEEEAAEVENLLIQYGCTGCHSLDGSKKVGPTFQGLFGREVTVLTEGKERTVTVDAEYIEKSILQPQADLVKGFPPVMPAFEGRIPKKDLEEIVEYFRRGEVGVKNKKTEGKSLLKEKGCLGCHSTDGSKSIGPTFMGLLAREVTVEKGGKTQTLTADPAYIRESIRAPKAAIVQGFPPVMPAFPDLSEGELDAIVEYIEELR